jgi:hypothetical protein
VAERHPDQPIPSARAQTQPGCHPVAPRAPHRPESFIKRAIVWLTSLQGLLAALTSVIIAVGALVFAIKQFGGGGSASVGADAQIASSAAAGAKMAPGVAITTDGVSPTAAARVPLYTLPANSTGQMGPQQGPIDVTLGGRRSQDSTAVTCSGSITFYLDGKYRILQGWAGVADFAPSATDNLLYIRGDGRPLETYSVTPDKVLPVNIEVTGVKVLELEGSDRGISKCTNGSKTFDYLGDAVVF